MGCEISRIWGVQPQWAGICQRRNLGKCLDGIFSIFSNNFDSSFISNCRRCLGIECIFYEIIRRTTFLLALVLLCKVKIFNLVLHPVDWLHHQNLNTWWKCAWMGSPSNFKVMLLNFNTVLFSIILRKFYHQ